jgi:uncharacterized membrane protein YphA (DoxX/SURF4 family)
MPDLQLRVIDDQPPIILRVLRATLPILFGLLFTYIGWTKFDSHSMWVEVFARIGLGQWFRYLTGAMQITGGLLLAVPPTRIIGSAMLACTMLGAVVVDLFVLNAGPLAIVPVVLCGMTLAIGGQAWIARS